MEDRAQSERQLRRNGKGEERSERVSVEETKSGRQRVGRDIDGDISKRC